MGLVVVLDRANLGSAFWTRCAPSYQLITAGHADQMMITRLDRSFANIIMATDAGELIGGALWGFLILGVSPGLGLNNHIGFFFIG